MVVSGGNFFFQAEDGIRDLVRSRGLGDVYKRQELDLIRWRWHTALGIKYRYNHFNCHYTFYYRSKEAVSYTHLTLPTSDLV